MHTCGWERRVKDGAGSGHVCFAMACSFAPTDFSSLFAPARKGILWGTPGAYGSGLFGVDDPAGVGRFCSPWEILQAPLPSLHASERFGCGITCQCGFDVPRRKSGLPTCPFWPDAACMIQAVSGTRWVETDLQPESRRLGPRGQCGPLGSPRLRGPSGPAMRAESMGRQVFMLPLNQLAT